jgi:hypothetical protein
VILYVLELPEHTMELPLMTPGCEGAEPPPTVTLNVCTEDEPQALFAFTVIFPPNAPATVEIEFVEELPVQPPGNVQV